MRGGKPSLFGCHPPAEGSRRHEHRLDRLHGGALLLIPTLKSLCAAACDQITDGAFAPPITLDAAMGGNAAVAVRWEGPSSSTTVVAPSSLTALNLKGCRRVTDDGVTHIGHRFPLLTALNISGSGVSRGLFAIRVFRATISVGRVGRVDARVHGRRR